MIFDMEKNIFDTIDSLKIEITFFTILFAIIFFQIQRAEMKTIISMLLITVWLIALFFYLKYKSEQIGNIEKQELAIIENENTKKLETPEINSTNYYVKGALKKGLNFMNKNEILVKIAKDLIFVKTFDQQKYQEMLVYMNQYQKVYMYILAERYPCKSYVPTFLDLRENILELLYQFYLVIPKNFKHIYGVEPYKKIEENIETFLKLSRHMITVLENFCRLDLKEHYFPMTSPMPFDEVREKEKRNILP